MAKLSVSAASGGTREAAFHRIIVVGADGGFQRAFGREGDGPGEFRSPGGIAVMPDGRGVMGDLGHRGHHIFGADGEFERMVRMAP